MQTNYDEAQEFQFTARAVAAPLLLCEAAVLNRPATHVNCFDSGNLELEIDEGGDVEVEQDLNIFDPFFIDVMIAVSAGRKRREVSLRSIYSQVANRAEGREGLLTNLNGRSKCPSAS